MEILQEYPGALELEERLRQLDAQLAINGMSNFVTEANGNGDGDPDPDEEAPPNEPFDPDRPWPNPPYDPEKK